ncbi:MAG: bifunctional diguanylate cyclase/phosphodiesterase [Clostridiales bacterium]|nr:bifunctional diguanylate cyclase/phosphodiesterase [Clostridiales bacterium]
MDNRIEDILFEMIDHLDISETEIGKLWNDTFPEQTKFAEMFGIARIDINFRKKPNFLYLKGYTRNISRDFSFDVDPNLPPVEFDAASNLSVYKVKVFPVTDRIWSEEEVYEINNILKTFYLLLSRASAAQDMEKAGKTDPLTGLMNHMGIIKLAESPKFRSLITTYTGCFINLKDFKYINNRIGEKAGNEVLRRYAMFLYNLVDQEYEIVGRLGGDNFFVLIRNERLDHFLDHLENCVFALTDPSGYTSYIKVNSRVGIYESCPGDGIDEILSKSSMALAQAKHEKMDTLYFVEDMSHLAMKEKEIINSLPKAVARRDITPYYQPKVNLKTMEICGCEALARWQSGDRIYSPGEFLGVIEKNNMTKILDFHILECVCRDLREWIDKDIHPVRVSVNFSKSDLFEPDLAGKIRDVVNKYDIPVDLLEIELTETARYDDSETLARFVSLMHEYGIKVSMDDFGNGYSSVNLLRKLNFDIVKLDRDFVSSISTSAVPTEKDIIFANNIMKTLYDMGLEVIAEGIENVVQLDAVRDIECTLIQGYIFDKPLPKEEFEKRLHTRKYEVRNESA